MKRQTYRDRLNKTQGERVFLDAQRTLMKKPRYSLALIACFILSLMILAIPIGVIASGIWIVILNIMIVFSILGSVAVSGGLILIWLGYMLLPRSPKNNERVFSHKEIPMMFALLDDVAKALGARTPDGVQFSSDVNSFVTSYGFLRQQNVISIGIPLWGMLSPQERVAILAHEIAHFVNGDPARGRLVGLAMQTVQRWLHMWADEPDTLFRRDFYAVIFEVLQWFLRLPIKGVEYLLMHLQYYASQRAEYMADGLAARVSGAEALISSLRKLSLTPLAIKAISQLHPYTHNQNARVFDTMITGVEQATKEERIQLEAKASLDKTRIDQSHPPTIYRITFLELLTETPALIDAQTVDFESIKTEMQTEADRQGRRLMQRYEVQ